MNRIDVAIAAWPNHPKRLEYFQLVVESLREHLTASRHELRLFCSAETERDPARRWCGLELEHLCTEHGISLSWRDAPANLGANMNAALAMCTGDYILLQQEDWRLKHPLDLSDGADFLAARGHLSVVDEPLGASPFLRPDILRYSWPEDPKMHPAMIEQPRWPCGYRQIDVGGKWPYGDDPHLRRPGFMHDFGWYHEGGRHGSASASMMKFLVRRRAVIAAAGRCYYKHCGSVSSVLNDKRKRRVPR